MKAITRWLGVALFALLTACGGDDGFPLKDVAGPRLPAGPTPQAGISSQPNLVASAPQAVPSAPSILPPTRAYHYPQDFRRNGPPAGHPCNWVRAERGYWPESFLDSEGRTSRATWQGVRDCGFPQFTWEEIAADALWQFKYYANAWGNNNARVQTAYGVLQAVDNIVFDWHPTYHEGFRRWTLKQIYRTPAMRQAVYAWFMPQVVHTFRTLAPAAQQSYIRVLEHAEEYLVERFDYAVEAKYFEDLAHWDKCRDRAWLAQHNLPFSLTRAWQCERIFIGYDPEGRRSDYRKIEAYVFRRFNQDGIGPVTQLYWIRRALADLRVAAIPVN